MTHPTTKVALLLFGSGACSLVYETVWLRELRLVFGASTMASAAVVACFIGGLGAGALVLGKRADAHPRPLALYSMLEGGIALSAALTPALLAIVRAAYVGLGGTRVLGFAGGSVVRLLFAAIVFALPTFLMGGTLPAVARAIENDEDRGRRSLALLYAANTFGAVTGCMLSTFVLLEAYGARFALWIACAVNVLVALGAHYLARGTSMPVPRAPSSEVTAPRAVPTWFTLGGAGVAGFVFCLMELVWYRMLTPLLGGTVFSFGLVLAIALLGVGLGGAAYGLLPRTREATIGAFAWACVLEAAFVAVPYALGDRLALLAVLLHPLGGLSFPLEVAEWAVITSIVVLPTAIASGVQFPLLVGLLGRGDERVGRDVGLTYAANTIGAIAGSLAGGFGLLPALTAPGCWRLVVWLLLALGAGAVALDMLRRPVAALSPLPAAILAVFCVRAVGPTAAWRHSPIGAGRVDAATVRTPNGARGWEQLRRRSIAWEAEGLESSIAIDNERGLAFIVNGKADGNARNDAGTPVMLGLLGAMIVPHPTRAMVIGLGTGETAGWLGAIESITEVDVAELESAVLEVARRSDVVNHGALENPKVHVEVGDARELLLTSRKHYDLVASEPSNPYRAGVASLFTRDYYEAVASHLEEDGVFVQWLQGYEVDARTVRTVYATLASVFPEVETWELSNRDMALVGAKKPIVYDLARMRALMTEEPFRSGIGYTWRATDLEGFFSHFVASADLARRVARHEAGELNTDDRNLVEFGFARSVGTGDSFFAVDDVRRAARQRDENRPKLLGEGLDWDRVDDGIVELYLANMDKPSYPEERSLERAHRMAAMRAFDEANARRVVEEWRAQPREPAGPTQTALVASALAELGDESALAYADALRGYDPAELDAVVAHLRLRQGRVDDAATALEALFSKLRESPWPMLRLVVLALNEAREIVARDLRFAPRIYAALREPFALHVHDETRKQVALAAALRIPSGVCVEAFDAYEPDVPWEEGFLTTRRDCYKAQNDPRAERAEDDLQQWRRGHPTPFAEGLDAQ